MCILYLKAKKNEARLTYTFASSLSLRNIQHSQSPRISWISWKTTWGTCTRGGIFLRVRKLAVPRRSNRSRAGTRCHGASGGSGYPHTASPLGGRERETNTEKHRENLNIGHHPSDKLYYQTKADPGPRAPPFEKKLGFVFL